MRFSEPGLVLSQPPASLLQQALAACLSDYSSSHESLCKRIIYLNGILTTFSFVVFIDGRSVSIKSVNNLQSVKCFHVCIF